MRREDLAELHYITHISNLPSIMRNGILSHRRAERIRHVSVALEEVQERRAGKRIPGGRLLHEYVNLYLCARNPMMYRRRNQHAELCVLRIALEVLDLPGVVIADRNASSEWASFHSSPRGLHHIDGELLFAEYWVHEDEIATFKHRSIKCAEILVPDVLQPGFITGVYVSCRESAQQIRNAGVVMDMDICPYLFFR